MDKVGPGPGTEEEFTRSLPCLLRPRATVMESGVLECCLEPLPEDGGWGGFWRLERGQLASAHWEQGMRFGARSLSCPVKWDQLLPS